MDEQCNVNASKIQKYRHRNILSLLLVILLLVVVQKNVLFRRFEVWSMLHLLNLNEWFLDRVGTGGEKWILYGSCKKSAQWLDDNEATVYFPKLKLH